MLSQRAARQSLCRAFHLQRLPLSHTPPQVPLLPHAARRSPSRMLFTHPPQTLTICPSRANHTIPLPKLADQCGSPQGKGLAPPTPPPPSATSPPTKFRHNNSLLLPQSSPSHSSRSFPEDKIASRRSAQIARHLSSSASLSTLQTEESQPTMASEYSVRKVGAPNTLEHRVYIEKDGVPVSAFHDVPLYADQEKGILNMIVEIPRWSNAKLEVSLSTATTI